VIDLLNPFNNRYVMYYDITDGSTEEIALAVSVDGITWSKTGPLAVIPRGVSPGTWDQNYASEHAVVLQLAPNSFMAWYSGGINSSREGIGCASSTDGVNWTKFAGNPIFSIYDGVLWRNSRTYNPWVLFDPSRFNGHGDPVCYKFWMTGAPATDPGDTAIGYATPPVPLINVSPPSFDFGNVVIGQTSPPQSFVVQNIGFSDLSIFAVTITGPNAAEFQITSDTCTGSTLAPGATCTIVVVFAPITPGPKFACLMITSNADNTPILDASLSGNGALGPATANDCILVNKVYDQCVTEELVTSQVPLTSVCPGVTIPAGATVSCIPIPGSATCTFAGTVDVTPPLTPFFEEVLVLNSFDISAPIFVAGVTVCSPTLTLTGAAQADLWVPPGTTVNCDILSFGDCTCTLLASPTGLPVVLACTGKICKELQITAPVKLLVPSYGFCDVPACTFLPQPGFACPPEPLFPPERCQGTPTVCLLGMGGVPISGMSIIITRDGILPTITATTDLTGTASFPTIGGLEGAIDVVSFTYLGKTVSFPIPLEFVDVAGIAHDSATTCSLIFIQTGFTTGLPIFTVVINGFLLGSGTPGVPAMIDP
jgi:hypothetical protein